MTAESASHRRKLAWALMPLLATALLLGLGLRKYDNADAVIPVLCSLEQYTPSYWGQSRFGMFLPLLVMPLRDPRLNYFAQAVLAAGAWVGAALMLPGGLRGGLATLAVCLICCSDQALAPITSFSQPYSVGLVLALGGWQVAQRRHWLSAGALYLAAFWVNISQAPLALLLAGRGHHRRLVLGCALINALLARLNPYYMSEEYRLQLPSAESLKLLLGNVVGALWLGPCLAVLVGAAWFWRADRLKRQPDNSQWRRLLAGAALLLGLVACSAWVEGNGYPSRYFSVGYFWLAAVTAGPLATRSGVWLAWCLPLLVLVRIYPFDPDAALRDWHNRSLAGEARNLGAVMLGGNYFIVYPSIFWDRGLAPLTHRGEVLRQRWLPLIQSGQTLAVRPDQWNELVFSRSDYCDLPARQWVSLERSQQLVAVGTGPLRAAPSWDETADLERYVGLGWCNLGDGRWQVHRAKADLLVQLPEGARGLELDFESPGRPRRVQAEEGKTRVGVDVVGTARLTVPLGSGPHRLRIINEQDAAAGPFVARGVVLGKLVLLSGPRRKFTQVLGRRSIPADCVATP